MRVWRVDGLWILMSSSTAKLLVLIRSSVEWYLHGYLWSILERILETDGWAYGAVGSA